jgi:sugar lactone lactonase YvrE
MIRPELAANQQVVHRFVKEAGHLQKLKHHNVVPVLELSDRPQGAYFVMPYFERGSVAHLIKPGHPLDNEFVLDIALPVAEGLQFAHRRGIIHRDLKPANLLLDAAGHACLADFGLARTMFNDSIIDVEREQLEGTAPYMSPGVAAGNAEDTRCDIYAFGALLYEMLTGEPPFAGRTTNEIRQQILAGPPKPIKARNPAADANLTAVAEGAMARELRDRYADMADVVADLQRIKAGKQPAGPHGLARHVRKVPVSLWIPVGLALLGLVLWMTRSAAPPKAVTPPAPVTPTSPIVVPTPPAVLPAPPAVTSGWTSPVIAGQIGVAGSNDGPGPQARFRAPWGIAADGAGNIYVADMGNCTIRKITPDGYVTTLAGAPGKSGPSDGPAAEARFTAPMGIAVDRSGIVYVSDLADGTIRKITPDGVVSTLAGLAKNPGSADGSGDNAQFRNPLSLAVDAAGNVFVADQGNFSIRKISPAGNVTTLRGHFGYPNAVAVDGAGNLYVADASVGALWKITPKGAVSRLGGTLSHPESVAVNARGDVYVTDAAGIHLLSADGAGVLLPPLPLTPSATEPVAHPAAIAVAPDGGLFIADCVNNIICRRPVK